jgi:hypothetical protein
VDWPNTVGLAVLTAIVALFFYKYIWSSDLGIKSGEESCSSWDKQDDRKPDPYILSDIDSISDPDQLMELAEDVMWNMDTLVPVEAEAFLKKLNLFSEELDSDEWYTVFDISPENSPLQKLAEKHLEQTC